MPWKPGESGNPAGRRPGTGDLTRLRAAIAEHVPGIMETLVQKAKEGDTQAARLLLERTLPVVKPVALPEVVPLPPAGTLAERAEALLRAMAAGQASPDAAETALNGLAALAKLRALDDLERRIAALEAKGKPHAGADEADRGAGGAEA